MDARNHGDSPHTEEMSYDLMAGDLARLVHNLNLPAVSLAGHSMGGRTVMMAAVKEVVNIEKLVVLDISPVNQSFDVTSSNEWNMEHFFHCLKVCFKLPQDSGVIMVSLQAVKFDQSLPISQARKEADRQLAVRIQDAGLRAWLLMNMKQDPVTKHIGWKINLDGIHSAFYNNIARFPSVSGTFNKWGSNILDIIS